MGRPSALPRKVDAARAFPPPDTSTTRPTLVTCLSQFMAAATLDARYQSAQFLREMRPRALTATFLPDGTRAGVTFAGAAGSALWHIPGPGLLAS